VARPRSTSGRPPASPKRSRAGDRSHTASDHPLPAHMRAMGGREFGDIHSRQRQPVPVGVRGFHERQRAAFQPILRKDHSTVADSSPDP
jgi:hypothetical protein